jgi:hypothetical protein
MTTTLEGLLDATRDALLSGDIDALSGLDERVAQEAAGLPALSVAEAERLRRKAERNARLLRAAAHGLRSARDRVTDIISGPALSTYDARGRKSSVPCQARALGRF